MTTNVLLCHRDGLVADAIRSYLSEQDFEVDLASTLDEMLERSHEAGACLVDMGMPGVSLGIRSVVAQPGAPRVLAFVDRETQVVDAVEAGADGCVASADGLDRLVQLLRCDIVLTSRSHTEAAQRELRRASKAFNGPVLTAREIEVLTGLVHGESTKALAERLHVRPATARTHVQHLLAKLGVHSRLQAVAFVIDNPIDLMPDWTGDGRLVERGQSAS
jgi:two-component system nitrate/nitrite response regulator NarL